uniref:C2 domain-containing protein n=1 Tax=Arion vulgaris TaxID=1028688 RepID=A0A0B7A5P3_9EUPU
MFSRHSNLIMIFVNLQSSFCKYPLPADPDLPLPPRIFQNLPKGDPEECIVRVYVIRAYDLQPCDPNGLADPYLEIELGKQLLSTKDDYIPNTLHPTFGSLFELKALLPIYKDLIIRVKDYDLLTLDDTVGETTIDLENRYLTRFRATCGLPKTYCVSGVNTWRDSQKPTDILIEYCKTNRHQPPVFVSKTEVTIGNKYYKLSDFESNVPESKLWGQENERLALHILNLTPFVKEHVESRALFNALQPGLEQGRVQMWVDIFPKSLGPPGPPFDITAREPVKFVLSCVIWNTYDVILDDVSFTGQKMSDIYVQGWMEGIDDKLKTDVHYRSLNGEGNFNWRFVYPFDYLMAEQKMVVKKKEHLWSLDKTEFKKPPKLILQIWDNDKFFSDDFLGQLELDLNSMPLPVKRSRSCNLNMLPEVGHHVKLSSLFEMKHAKGFWPCHNDSSGVPKLTGKLEMELQLMPAVDFDKRPSGVGRDEPNVAPKLDAPKRPDTSFLWFMSPWKSLKFVIWLNYKAVIIRGLFFILLVLLILIFVYSFPGNFSFWLMNRL